MLPDALRARGAEVDVLALYETVAEPLRRGAVQDARAADYVTFTSSSTVRNLSSSRRPLGGEPAGAALSPHTRIVSIGPLTSETLRERGVESTSRPHRHDIDGLLQALLADASAHREPSAVPRERNGAACLRRPRPPPRAPASDRLDERSRARAGRGRRAARDARDGRCAERRARAPGAPAGRRRPAARC